MLHWRSYLGFKIPVTLLNLNRNGSNYGMKQGLYIFVDRRACAWELRKVVFVSKVKIVSNVIFIL